MKLDRLIIENIEGRIMLGLVMTVAIMILIGWVAINEPGRMAAFEQQHTGRSIERGAELYAANCSTCHGTSGYGQTGIVPALNNPHFFGYDYLADVNGQIARLERQLIDEVNPAIDSLTVQRDEAFTALVSAEESEREALQGELNDIDDQLAALNERLETINAELVPLYEEREATLASMNQAMLRGYYPSLEAARQEAEDEGNPLIFTNYLAEDASRLSQVGWGGDLHQFIVTTLQHGRPGSNDVWGGNDRAMVAWQQPTGPLRYDQVEDIATYILNWDKGDNWTMDDLERVNQFARLHVPYTGESSGGEEQPEPIGQDVEDILQNLDGVTGDVERGEQLYTGMAQSEFNQLVGCSSCHAGGAVGPNTVGTWSRVENERLTLPQFDGYSVQQYLVESIVRPADYAVPGYAGAMPMIYGEQMSIQDMADILAYLESQDG